jgi:tetratricopeptide (TPR) repeat protein
MARKLRRIGFLGFAACSFFSVCGFFSACGFFSDKHREEAPSSRPPMAPVSATRVPDYSRLTADHWLNLSRALYLEGKYLESIGAAQTALSLKPDFALAYNNIGAAYAALRLWDPAIQADQQAARLEPGMQLARNNLNWALAQKALEKR